MLMTFIIYDFLKFFYPQEKSESSDCKKVLFSLVWPLQDRKNKSKYFISRKNKSI